MTRAGWRDFIALAVLVLAGVPVLCMILAATAWSH